MVDLAHIAEQIDNADIYALAKHTPVEKCAKLSEEFGTSIWLKREDLQDVFSFKNSRSC